MLAPLHRGASGRLHPSHLPLSAQHLRQTSICSTTSLHHILRFAHTAITRDADDNTFESAAGNKIKIFQYGPVQNQKSGKSFKRKTASLPVTTMGKTAKVIILESTEDEIDEQLSYSEVEVADEPVSAGYAATAPSNISADLLKPSGTKARDLENAQSMIEKMRPIRARNDCSTFIDRSTMDELARQLNKQFNVEQLKEYVRRHPPASKVESPTSPLLEQPLPQPWHVERNAVVGDADVDAKTAKQTQKAVTISNLLERSWGLRVENEGDDVVSVLRKIPGTITKLLTAGYPSALDDLATMFNITYKVDIVPPKGFRRSSGYSLTMIGPKKSIRLATNRMKNLLESSKNSEQRLFINSLQRPTRHWPDRQQTERISLEHTDLRRISHETGAVLGVINYRKILYLQIMGIKPEKILAAKQTVLPLLMSREASSKFSICAGTADETVDLIKSPVPVLQRLPPPYHNSSLKRLTGVNTNASAFDATEHTEWVTGELMPTLKSGPQAFKGDDAVTGWKPLQPSISAKIGFQLHCGTPDEAITTISTERGRTPSQPTDPYKSYFWPTAPNAHHLFRRLNNEEEKIKRTVKVKICLTPDPTEKYSAWNNVPDIEITFALNIHEPGFAKLQQVVANLKHDEHTILLPHAPVDVRFHHGSRAIWDFEPPTTPETTLLSEFCKTAASALEAGKSVRHLPGFLISFPAKMMDADQKALRVPYIVANVQQRETISFKLTDDTIPEQERVLPWYSASYALIKSGNPAYTTSELTVRLPGADETQYKEDIAGYRAKLPQIRQEFVRTVLWLVNKLDYTQRRAVNAKSQKPDDDMKII